MRRAVPRIWFLLFLALLLLAFDLSALGAPQTPARRMLLPGYVLLCACIVGMASLLDAARNVGRKRRGLSAIEPVFLGLTPEAVVMSAVLISFLPLLRGLARILSAGNVGRPAALLAALMAIYLILPCVLLFFYRRKKDKEEAARKPEPPPPNHIICPQCGEMNGPEAWRCMYCGFVFEFPEPQKDDSDKHRARVERVLLGVVVVLGVALVFLSIGGR